MLLHMYKMYMLIRWYELAYGTVDRPYTKSFGHGTLCVMSCSFLVCFCYKFSSSIIFLPCLLLWSPTRLVPMVCVLPRSSGVEELKEFIHEESQETCPDSAGSTGVMGTALERETLIFYSGIRVWENWALSLWWIGLGFAFTITAVPWLLPKPSEPLENGCGISWFNYFGPGAPG